MHLVRRAQELTPEHETVQRLVLHWMSSAHAFVPPHCTSHDVAIPQFTFFLHACSPQITRHGRFGGHITSVGHALSGAQSITHTPATHVPFVQPSSHTFVAASGVLGEIAASAAVAGSSPSSSCWSAVEQATASGIVHQPSRQL